MSNQLIQEYQSICSYHISDSVQQLDIPIDIEKIQKELLNFLVHYQYGTNPVSLRLHKESTDPLDFVDAEEDVWNQGISVLQTENINLQPKNTRADSDYVHWHPGLASSYTKTLVELLENFSGLKIGRVRLVWLLPRSGYPMHVDLEPMRFHIPLVTNKLSYFISDDKIYHMEYGKVYHLITTTEHTTHNFGDVARLHLIFSTHADSHISNAIQNSINENYSVTNYFNQLKDSGLNRKSLFQLMQIDSGYKEKYQKIIDNL